MWDKYPGDTFKDFWIKIYAEMFVLTVNKSDLMNWFNSRDQHFKLDYAEILFHKLDRQICSSDEILMKTYSVNVRYKCFPTLSL